MTSQEVKQPWQVMQALWETQNRSQSTHDVQFSQCFSALSSGWGRLGVEGQTLAPLSCTQRHELLRPLSLFWKDLRGLLGPPGWYGDLYLPDVRRVWGASGVLKPAKRHCTQRTWLLLAPSPQRVPWSSVGLRCYTGLPSLSSERGWWHPSWSCAKGMDWTCPFACHSSRSQRSSPGAEAMLGGSLSPCPQPRGLAPQGLTCTRRPSEDT